MVAIVALSAFAAAPSAVAQTALTITSSPPPNGVVGVPYAHAFTTNPVDPPPTFAVTSGALPPGITMPPSGFVAGAPLQAGTFGPTTVCAPAGGRGQRR